MISDQQIYELFDEFLASPELKSWRGDLIGRELADAQKLFQIAVRKAIILNEAHA
jgi:hypothetical protein